MILNRKPLLLIIRVRAREFLTRQDGFRGKTTSAQHLSPSDLRKLPAQTAVRCPRRTQSDSGLTNRPTQVSKSPFPTRKEEVLPQATWMNLTLSQRSQSRKVRVRDSVYVQRPEQAQVLRQTQQELEAAGGAGGGCSGAHAGGEVTQLGADA